jgi:hypothetical protein
MSKHSPGPWYWGENKYGGKRLFAPDMLAVLWVEDPPGASVDGEEADCNLIADAPTMLELLGELLKTDPYGEEFRDCQWCGKPSSESHHPDCAYTRALELVKRHGV